MNKLARYGFLLIVLLVGLTVLAFDTQPVYANEESEIELTSSNTDKDAAIEAADRAIRRVPRSFRYLDPVIEENIAEARRLVDRAKANYGAERADFSDLDRLEAAEKQLEKTEAIEAARDAIDKIPPPAQITEAHRSIIEEARRLTDIAKEDYGATRLDLCWRYEALVDAEERLEEAEPEPDPVPDPDPDPDPDPLPPTGALTTTVVSGLLMAGAGLLFLGKRKNRF